MKRLTALIDALPCRCCALLGVAGGAISRVASRVAFALLLLPLSAVSQSARDVSPEPGIVWGGGNSSETFLFRGNAEVLVSSGRGGVRETDNFGNHWRRSMSGLVDSATGIEPFAGLLCQAPSARSTVYIASIAANNPVLVDRPYRSDDFGRTWRPLAGLNNSSTVDCAVDPLNPELLYVLAADNTDGHELLFKSTDGGQHFASVGAGLQQNDGPNSVRVSPRDLSTVYVLDGGTYQGLYVSTDGGLNFARSRSAPDNPMLLFLHPTEPDTLFLTNPSGLFRSTDGGATFTHPLPLSPAPSGLNGAYLAFDPRDAQTSYVATGLAGLFRTRDGGATYSRLPGPTSGQLGNFGVANVGIPPAGAPIYVSTSYGPLRSDDDGQTFVPNQGDYHGAVVNDLGFDAAGRLLVGTFHTLQLFRGARPGHPEPYESPGATIIQPGAATAAIAASPVDPNVLLVALAFDLGALRTDNGGATWTRISGISTVSPFARMTFAPGDASRAYYVNGRGAAAVAGFYRSTDEGRSFARTFGERLGSVVVDPSNANTVYVGTWEDGNGLFKSTDGGLTFTPLPLTASQAGDFGSLAIDPTQTQTVYAGRRQGGVLRSDDGGATWVLLSGPPGGEVLGVALDPQRPAHVFAWIQGAGLYRSDDRGSTWRAADTEEAKQRSGVEAGRGTLVADPKVSGRVYIGNSGVVQIDTNPAFVYTNDNASPNTVSAFSIGAQGTLTKVGTFPTGGIGGGTLAGSNRIVPTIARNLIYATNGGSNDISAFSIDRSTGALSSLGPPVPTGGLDGQGVALAVTPDGQFLYAASCCGSNTISAFSIGSDGTLTPIGSPISAGGQPDGIKVSPDGRFLAVGLIRLIGKGVDMFSIGPGGALTLVSGSPFPVAGAPYVDINCNSNLLFAGHASFGPTKVSVFSIASDGTLSEIANSPFIFGGTNSNVVVLSPDDQHLFVSNQTSNTITSLEVGSGGSLTQVGSPFGNLGGSMPSGMATNRAGTFIYTANFNAVVTGFGIAENGALTSVPGSPFATGGTAGLQSLAVFPPKTCEDDGAN
jgi:6-phosphogluconolactonase